jgi:hypothetical protein
MKLIIVFILALILVACTKNDNPAGQSLTSQTDPIPYPYTTANFQFYYTSYDSASIIAIGDTMQSHYIRIVADLNSDTLPKIQIRFYKSYDDLYNAVKYIIPNLPSWAIGLATAQDQIHLISPKHPSYEYPWMLGNLIHEFAHCVSLHVKPNIGNNPRWLWESVAIYESNQFIHPSYLPYMVSQTPPTLEQLNSFNNTYVYDVGYVLAEYIITVHGKIKFNELIRNNGNIQTSIGMNSSQFQTAWFAFVKSKYGI